MGWGRAPGTGSLRYLGVQTVSLSHLTYGHSPDRRRRNARAQARGKRKPPITVVMRGGALIVSEGNDRVFYGLQANEGTIRAKVYG